MVCFSVSPLHQLLLAIYLALLQDRLSLKHFLGLNKEASGFSLLTVMACLVAAFLLHTAPIKEITSIREVFSPMRLKQFLSF